MSASHDTSSVPSIRHAGEESKLAERLYINIHDYFTQLCKNFELTELPHDDQRLWQEQAGRFYLWGESFREGNVAVIFKHSPSLYLTVVKFLANIARLLISRSTPSTPKFSNVNALALVRAAEKLSVPLQTADQYIAHLDVENEKDDIEDDSASSSSDGINDDSYDIIEFYLGLLMNLIPSMERLYKQHLLSKQTRGKVLPLSPAISSESLRPIPLEPSTMRSVKDKGHDQQVMDSSKIGPLDEKGFPREHLNTDWPADLREEIEKLPSEKTLASPDSSSSKPPSQKLPSFTLSQPPATPLSPFKENLSSYKWASELLLDPVPPADAQSKKFRDRLFHLSKTPLNYENPGLLDEAMRSLPLDTIFARAEKDHEHELSSAKSDGPVESQTWGYQDFIIRRLLRWFRGEFFSFVSNPPCSSCASLTIACGRATPTADEVASGASQVELYRCSNDSCGAYERFPRYSEVWRLMQTRRGRVGEWANCFSMLCRAVGSRVRWVWNSEDYVWTEVYSNAQRRWIHVDACEESWDDPRLYAQKWRKKMAYCIAFSTDGATDVTPRYVREPNELLGRTQCPDEVLLYIINEIRVLRRAKMSEKERLVLEDEDIQEEQELQNYLVKSFEDKAVQEEQSYLAKSLSPSVRASSHEVLAAKKVAGEQDRVQRGPVELR